MSQTWKEVLTGLFAISAILTGGGFMIYCAASLLQTVS